MTSHLMTSYSKNNMDSEFCLSFLWHEHCHSKFPRAWLCEYVSITVLFWQKIHGALWANIYLFQSMNSNTKVGYERCSRLIKKTLVRQKSIVVVHFVRFEQILNLVWELLWSFQKASKCPVWYLMRTNFGVEKIWRFWRFWSEIAKLSPRQNLFFSAIAKLNPRQI